MASRRPWRRLARSPPPKHTIQVGPEEVDLFRHEKGLTEELRRIYTLAKRVAKAAPY
jgi:hypothetical protein